MLHPLEMRNFIHGIQEPSIRMNGQERRVLSRHRQSQVLELSRGGIETKGVDSLGTFARVRADIHQIVRSIQRSGKHGGKEKQTSHHSESSGFSNPCGASFLLATAAIMPAPGTDSSEGTTLRATPASHQLSLLPCSRPRDAATAPAFSANL